MADEKERIRKEMAGAISRHLCEKTENVMKGLGVSSFLTEIRTE
jgi:hypothetical protein